MIVSLAEISQACANCQACNLHKTRTKVVFGEGSLRSRVILIGEGPGATEDETGRPFVGQTGQLLRDMLQEAGLDLQDVWITNTVRCRPPGNRDPLPEEVGACSAWLDQQIQALQPELYVLVGRIAMSSLIPSHKKGITRTQGEWLEFRGKPALVILHPSYISRQQTQDPGLRGQTVNHLKKLAARLAQLPVRPGPGKPASTPIVNYRLVEHYS